MDFNIPDATGPETVKQECDRVRPHIPPNLLDLWAAAVKAAEEPDDAESSGWPEMVATFLQLTPHRVMACIHVMGLIHLRRLNASMLKVESSTVCIALATGEAMELLAGAYRMAKMQAVLTSQQLRGDPLMHPYVERIRTLLEEADSAIIQLRAAGQDDPDHEIRNMLQGQAAGLETAVAGVRELLGPDHPQRDVSKAAPAGQGYSIELVELLAAADKAALLLLASVPGDHTASQKATASERLTAALDRFR